MKLGLGLYRHMLTRENFQFARQAGATHIVAHLVDYFHGGDHGHKTGHDNQPTGAERGWGRAGDPDKLWTLEELQSLRREVKEAELELQAMLGDPAVPETTKERLRLAMAARDFGIKVLGLRGGDAYTRYLETNGKPVAWNVSAAPKDRLRAVMYKFPITGRVPYLGFFKEADARREEARLNALDLDVYVRGVSGYSTLGITSDPIYSSMLEGPRAPHGAGQKDRANRSASR